MAKNNFFAGEMASTFLLTKGLQTPPGRYKNKIKIIETHVSPTSQRQVIILRNKNFRCMMVQRHPCTAQRRTFLKELTQKKTKSLINKDYI